MEAELFFPSVQGKSIPTVSACKRSLCSETGALPSNLLISAKFCFRLLEDLVLLKNSMEWL